MNEVNEWKKKKKEFEFFFDFDSIQGLVDDLMKDLAAEENNLQRKPMVMGFNIKMSSGGKPIIERFGNIKAEKGRPKISNARAPLVDVTESEKEITITAELPGVEKKQIGFRLLNKNSAIIDINGERSFYKELELPAAVKEKSARAKFKNGILEVKLGKETPGKLPAKEGEVKIE